MLIAGHQLRANVQVAANMFNIGECTTLDGRHFLFFGEPPNDPPLQRESHMKFAWLLSWISGELVSVQLSMDVQKNDFNEKVRTTCLYYSIISILFGWNTTIFFFFFFRAPQSFFHSADLWKGAVGLWDKELERHQRHPHQGAFFAVRSCVSHELNGGNMMNIIWLYNMISHWLTEINIHFQGDSLNPQRSVRAKHCLNWRRSLSGLQSERCLQLCVCLRDIGCRIHACDRLGFSVKIYIYRDLQI